MTGWPKQSLADVAKLRAGIGFPRELQGRSQQKYPFAKVGDISAVARAGETAMSDARNAVSEEDLETLRAAPFPAGTIAFAKIGEAISQNFRVVTTRPMLLDNNVMGVIPDPLQVDTRYLLRYLQSVDFYALTGKTAVPAIRKSILEKVKIPLPPLPEQRRIAAILDKADAVRRKRQQTLGLADQFLRSAFLDMFGRGIEEGLRANPPEGWLVCTINDIKEPSKYSCVGGPFGSSLTRSDYIEPPGVPVIRGGNLGTESGRFIEEGFVYVTERKAADLVKNTAQPGDIVFTQRGTLGQVARIPLHSKFPLYIVSQSQMKLTVNEGIADPDFIVWLFRSPFLKRQLELRILATGVPHINLGILKGLPVILPPITMQRGFSCLLSLYQQSQQVLGMAASASALLSASLTQRAFRGELTNDY